MKKQRIWGTLDPFMEGGACMGRKVANAGFLQTLIHSQSFDEYHFFLTDDATLQNTRKNLELISLPPSSRVRFFLRRQLPEQLIANDYHCFHLSDCINWPAHLAALRNRYSRQLFPITSLTHSLSLTRYVREMLPQLWEGTTPRDCIISSSLGGKTVVENIFAQGRTLLGRGAEDVPQPACRVIPLGIDAEGFAPLRREERESVRKEYGVGEKDVVVLVFGRVSPHSKMDILPLLRAVQRLFAQGVKRSNLRLMIAGWVEPKDELPRTLQALAHNMGLRMDIIASPDDEAKRRLFGGADIFVSLADNPQETFGLSLLEAGSMGLPAIASDFDGYREIIVHDHTGLLVPTLGHSATGFIDEMAPLVSDYHYHLWLAQGTAVSVPMLAESLGRLLRDADVRQRMGEAGRERVVTLFSWEKIVARYAELWDELWEKPVARESLLHQHPLNMAYGKVFGEYCTARLLPSDCFVWTRCGQAVYREQEFPLIYAGLEDWIFPEIIKRLLFCCRKPVSAKNILNALQDFFAHMTEDRLHLLLMWALKQDFIEKVPAGKNV